MYDRTTQAAVATVERLIGEVANTGDAACELAGEKDVRELRLAVARNAHHAVPTVGPLEVVEVQLSEFVSVGGDVDDPRRCARGQHGKQQTGEEERAEVIHGQHHFMALSGLLLLAHRDPRVVHQQVQAFEPLFDLGCRSAHVGLQAQVGEHDLGRGPVDRRVDVGLGLGGALHVAADEDDVIAGPCQPPRRLEADP